MLSTIFDFALIYRPDPACFDIDLIRKELGLNTLHAVPWLWFSLGINPCTPAKQTDHWRWSRFIPVQM